MPQASCGVATGRRKCATPKRASPSFSAELLVELPLAYYVPPVSRTPGQVHVLLDFEQTRWANVSLLPLNPFLSFGCVGAFTSNQAAARCAAVEGMPV
jgi:hypothetical protein